MTNTLPAATLTIPAVVASIEETLSVGYVEPAVGSQDWLYDRLSLEQGPLSYTMKVMFAGPPGQDTQTIQLAITKDQFTAWTQGLLLHKVDGRFLPITLTLTLNRPEIPLALQEK